MARVPKTPGVYVEGVSFLPPFVVSAETAVPAFIGHTEKAADRTGDLKFTAVEIGSITEFREKYGVGPEVRVKAVHLQPDNTVSEVELDSEYYLYDSLRLFYDNGGGNCIIVSIGDFDEDVSADNLKKGLNELALEKRPTMLVMPDAIALADERIYGVQRVALKQCSDLQDRFAILDLLEVKGSTELSLKESVEDFRNEIGISYLKYGAAYVPHLRANLPKTATFRNIRGSLKRQGVKQDVSSLIPEGVTSTLGSVNNAIDDVDSIKDAISGFVRSNDGSKNDAMTMIQIFRLATDEFQTESGELLSVAQPANQLLATTTAFQHLFELTYALIQGTVDEHAIPNANNVLKVAGNRKIARDQISNILRASVQRLNKMTVGAISLTGAKAIDRLYTNFAVSATQWGGAYDAALAPLTGTDLTSVYPRDIQGLTIEALLRAQGQNMVNAARQVVSTFETVSESAVAILNAAKGRERQASEALQDAAPQLRKVIDKVTVAQTTLPPSGVIAGIYSYVDRTGGVFKAPANVSLRNVSDLTTIISAGDREGLHVNAATGKSINAICLVSGRGTLVCGARTLDGNSNEWRYVSVRRFFNMVEESCEDASKRFVFEPNDRNTWLKVRGMLETFLIIQWRAGALQGMAPEHAFFVKVGLGETMTDLDILEGRMIIEIGMAVVRPDEFILLRFSQKMPNS